MLAAFRQSLVGKSVRKRPEYRGNSAQIPYREMRQGSVAEKQGFELSVRLRLRVLLRCSGLPRGARSALFENFV